ncbi:MAG: sialate O-acetylesterase [Terrimicrobiaceae bacterium]
MMKKLLLLQLLLVCTVVRADITLPPLISDDMLLQRSQAAVWGKADPNETVVVELGGISAKATADKDGSWRVKLNGLNPGLAGTMTIAGKNTITLQNVTVGDVWVCSGQSNMSMWVGPVTTPGAWRGYKGVVNFEKEISSAQFPQIRMFQAVPTMSETPVDEVQGQWKVCTPENVKTWSAVGYFFARQLHQDLGIPIGMIHSSWGGTSAQDWTPSAVIEGDPALKEAYFDPWQTAVASYPAQHEAYEKALPAWREAVAAAKQAGTAIPREPYKPLEPFKPGMEQPGHFPTPAVLGTPGAIYNAMISGATKYPIKGAIWFQGESNSWDKIPCYDRLISAMVDSWRKAWGQGDFPFYIVQLANYQARRPEPADSNFALLRDFQRKISLVVPNSGLAVAIDIGDEKDIHPANKQEVGRRLALVAEAKTYGKNLVYSGPFFDSAEFDAAKAKITFKPGSALGLKTQDGGPIKGFAIAGEDKKFAWAEAQIVAVGPGAEETLVLSSAQIPKPVAVRYAWASNPEVNLVNNAGLPAVPFRTDDWPKTESSAVAPAPTPAANIPGK